MRGRQLPPRAGALILAGVVLLAGCGSSGTSAGSPPTSGTTPKGYVVHSANGFDVAAPAGWTGAPVTAGDGSIRTTLTAAGGNVGQVTTEYNAHPLQSVDQRIADEHNLATGTDVIHDVKDTVRTVTVAGAREARIVDETFTNAAGPARSEELLAVTRGGAFIEVGAVVSDRSSRSLDPNAVISSFRLTA